MKTLLMRLKKVRFWPKGDFSIVTPITRKKLELLIVFLLVNCHNEPSRKLWPFYYLLFQPVYQSCSLDQFSISNSAVAVKKDPVLANETHVFSKLQIETARSLIIEFIDNTSANAVFHSFQNKQSLYYLNYDNRNINHPIKRLGKNMSLYKVILPESQNQQIFMRLKNRKDVKNIQWDYTVKAATIPNDTLYSWQWGLKNTGQNVNGITGQAGLDINAELGWNVINDCSAEPMAIIDSGINYNHEDLQSNMWQNPGEIPGNQIDDDGNGYVDDVYGWDFVQNDNAPSDLLGHGTHVAGIAGAVGNNVSGISGVCWKAKLLSLRVLDETGQGKISAIIEAINYANNKNIKILNMSFVYDEGSDGDLVYNAIQKVRASGGLVVAAAGNDAKDNDASPVYPASYNLDNIIAVAGIDPNGNLASTSNYGNVAVDMAAPGLEIESSYPLKVKNSYIEGFASGLGSWQFKGGLSNWVTEKHKNPVTADQYCVLSDPSRTGFNYGNNWDTMIYHGYDLSGADLGYITYQLRIQTESLNDTLSVKYNESGLIPDKVVQSISGDFYSSIGWLQIEKVVPPSALTANYNLGFEFITNDNLTAEGISIANLQVYSLKLDNQKYTTLSGTSMATPHVSGVAALLFSLGKMNTFNCNYLHIKNNILQNGKTVSSLSGKTVTGKIPNIKASVDGLLLTGCP